MCFRRKCRCHGDTESLECQTPRWWLSSAAWGCNTYSAHHSQTTSGDKDRLHGIFPVQVQLCRYLYCVPVIKRVFMCVGGFSLLYRRSENLAFSLVLLIGCYSAILIPAYFPLNKLSAVSDEYQDPKDLVGIPHIIRHLKSSPSLLSHFSLCLPPSSSGLAKPISLPAVRPLSASLVSEPPQAPVLFCRPPGHPCVCAAGQACALGSVPSSGAPG